MYMSLFSRKPQRKPQPESPPKKVCDHKWTDIQDENGDCWYMEYDVNDRTFSYAIYQPYVCIHCKARKDILLENRVITCKRNSEAFEKLDEVKKQYPQIRPRAIVEDKINDFQLVDRDYLHYASLVIGRLPIKGSGDPDSGITYFDL